MNIVYITSCFPFGKSEVWAINELNSLSECGNEITIIPRSGKGTIINQDAKIFESNLVDLPFVNQAILYNIVSVFFSDPKMLLRLLFENIEQSNTIVDFFKGCAILPKSLFAAEFLKHSKIDHIHSLQTTSTAFMAHILSTILNVPWSYTLHTSEPLNSRYQRSFLFQSRSASLCRTISQTTAADLSSFIGPDLAKKVKKVHLGVGVTGFNRATSHIGKSFTIATPAELTNRKGHVYALGAAKKLIDAGITNFEWIFYGSGPLKSELEKEVKMLNLANYCYFPGNIDHHQLLNRYENNGVDLVVIASISTEVPEGIPVSLMEAMSYEIPVIATDCGGTRELVDGESGILIKQRDPGSIADAISEFINKNEYRREVGKNGRSKIENYFNTKENAKELVQCFNSV